MKLFRSIRNGLQRLRAWHNSRKMRRARRAVESVTDTAAAGVGFVIRLGVKIVFTALLVFITTGMLLACIFAVYVKTGLSERLDVTPQEFASSQSSRVLAETSPGSGQWVEIDTLYADVNRIWVDYEDIPIELEHACVAIEDRRFYTHKGVDWWRTVGAFGNMFLSMRDNFGGSTITQQLIKNLTGKDEVTVQRKLLEIFQALEFEKKYTKQQIMEWYLNQIYLGEGCSGVGTAARAYFGKEVWELDLAECASLIGITNNPSLYDPYIGPQSEARNKQRQEDILWAMYDQEYITYDQYISAKNETLHFKRAVGEEVTYTPNTYYVDSLVYDLIDDFAAARGINKDLAEQLIYNGGYDIYTCLDQRIQQIVDDVFQNTGSLPKPYLSPPAGAKFAAAIVVLDPKTGAVVALAGNVGEKTGSFTSNYATEFRRPPGSSFKPVAVYGPAFDLGLITQDTMVNDSPNIVLAGKPDWYPRNDSGGYSGWITIRQGVVSSLNTVAAQVLDKLGLQASWDYLTNRFGFTSLVRDVWDDASQQIVSDYVYPALALGQLSYGVTPLEMAQAFSAFDNDGVMNFGRLYSMVTDREGNVVLDNPARSQVAVKANTAWNITDMLHAATNGGTGSAANFYGQAVAGKTGTTSSNRDRYFTGFTPYYVAAVWTGYERNEKMYFYSNPAAQIWNTVMSRIHAGLPYLSFPTPSRGWATNIFGEAEETATPEPSETPLPTDTPEPPPGALDVPPTAEPPGGPEVPPPVTDVPEAPPVTDPPEPPVTEVTEAPVTDPPPATENQDAPPPPMNGSS